MYAFNSAAIFSPGHPYIESTTVLSDKGPLLDQLPELVKSALAEACKSGKSLSWKIQESNRWCLIQLVWKNRRDPLHTVGEFMKVDSNWNCGDLQSKNRPGMPVQRKRKPHTARRDAIEYVLERKRDSHLSQKRSAQSKGQSSHHEEHLPQRSSSPCEKPTSGSENDTDLRSFISEEVNCVGDFTIRDWQPGFDTVARSSGLLLRY